MVREIADHEGQPARGIEGVNEVARIDAGRAALQLRIGGDAEHILEAGDQFHRGGGDVVAR